MIFTVEGGPMDLGLFKTLSPRALKSILISAVATIATGLGFRTWRPEAALQIPEYIVVFLICFCLAYAANRILQGGSHQSKPADGKAPPAAEK
jgi:hypothetical protein